jgi:hypothetical protein
MGMPLFLVTLVLAHLVDALSSFIAVDSHYWDGAVAGDICCHAPLGGGNARGVLENIAA